jgi:hypothetical protein
MYYMKGRRCTRDLSIRGATETFVFYKFIIFLQFGKITKVKTSES